MKLLNNFRMFEKKKFVIFFSLLFSFTVLFTGCTPKENKPVIIWTSNTAFIPYVELFNSIQNKTKALVVYKKNSSEMLPVPSGGQTPDILIDSYLHSDTAGKYFQSLEYLFNNELLNPNIFYQQLLEMGSSNERQYLLPVSFNLPLVLFSSKYKNLVDDDYTLSLDQIQDIAGKFNKENDHGLYTNMGFAPNWAPEFLYLCTKFSNTNFTTGNTSFVWNKDGLSAAVSYLRNWTAAQNTSSAAEQDFAFKYLYTTYYQQAIAGHCLFSYTTSDKLFLLPPEDLNKIDYRWIKQDNKIPVEDAVVMMGIYKKSKNKDAAETFLLWFMKEKTQRELMQHTSIMHLDTAKFGIAGGFSGIKSVNEKVLPVYYEALLANVPVADYITGTAHLPLKWETMKNKIILPYLQDALTAENEQSVKPLEQRITEWQKQHF